MRLPICKTSLELRIPILYRNFHSQMQDLRFHHQRSECGNESRAQKGTFFSKFLLEGTAIAKKGKDLILEHREISIGKVTKRKSKGF